MVDFWTLTLFMDLLVISHVVPKGASVYVISILMHNKFSNLHANYKEEWIRYAKKVQASAWSVENWKGYTEYTLTIWYVTD